VVVCVCVCVINSRVTYGSVASCARPVGNKASFSYIKYC